MASSETSEVTIKTLIRELEAIKNAPPKDDGLRHNLIVAARNLVGDLETAGEAVQRIAYAPLQTIVVRVADNLKLFDALAATKNGSTSTAELAAACRSDEVLISRILRFLASFGIVKEVGEDTWSANDVSNALCEPGLMAGILNTLDVLLPTWQSLPEFLVETGYRNPSDAAATAFQKGHQTNLPPFQWLQQTPAYVSNFGLWMEACRRDQNNFLESFPFEKEIVKNVDPKTPLFVDVGGGIGPQCVAFKKKLPHLVGRVVLQDLQQVVDQAIPAEGVEKMVHNFRNEQPIKGARSYYMRNIMHDYPDSECVSILNNIKNAMNEDSIILIDDMVIPNKGASWRAMQLDITMMAGLAGIERTEKQWHSLMDAAGLKIRSVHTYNENVCDSVIVAVPR